MMKSFSVAAEVTRLRLKSGQSLLTSAATILIFAARTISAQPSEDAPPLLEPLPEIPPTFWEQHGILVVTASLAFIALLGILLWWLLQPKPTVPVPIEVRTRQELEALAREPENDQTLSKLSRCLRRYFAMAFGLPAGELTTTEFNRAFAAQGTVGGELVAAVGEFLQRADEKKFAPGGGGDSGAMQQALELFERGERRRVELQQMTAPK
jgi:hypothetical protein